MTDFIREEPYNKLPLLWPDEKEWKTFAVFEKLNLANKALAELGILEKEKVGTELIFKNVALYELFSHE